jgi:hypothetical protein
MLNNSSTEDIRGIDDPLEYFLLNHSDPEALRIIGDLVKHGGVPVDHEALRLAGCYAYATRLAKMLQTMQSELPNIIIDAANKNQIKAEEFNTNYSSALDLIQAQNKEMYTLMSNMLFEGLNDSLLGLKIYTDKIDTGVAQLEQKATMIVKKSMLNRRDFSAYLMFGAIGLCLGSIGVFGLFQFAILPKQLAQMRGGDAAILDWFSTPDGKIMYRGYKAGNKSVKACAKQEVDKTGKKKIRCDVSFYL